MDRWTPRLPPDYSILRMAVGPYEEEIQGYGEERSRGAKSKQRAQDYWTPVKTEPHWVQYVSDRDQAQSYESLDQAEPLELVTAVECADLPDLEFPVPAQDLIPDMVRESDIATTASSATPQESEVTESSSSTSSLLIPIQGSIVAHSRSGRPSIAAVTERRVKNTEAARRSRARRADKLYELRERNEELSRRNIALVTENERLRAIVRSLEDKLRINTE